MSRVSMDSTPEDLPTGGSEQISGNTDETSDYIFNDGLRQRWRLKKQEKKRRYEGTRNVY